MEERNALMATGISGIAGALAYVMATVLGDCLRPRYSHPSHDISRLTVSQLFAYLADALLERLSVLQVPGGTEVGQIGEVGHPAGAVLEDDTRGLSDR